MITEIPKPKCVICGDLARWMLNSALCYCDDHKPQNAADMIADNTRYECAQIAKKLKWKYPQAEWKDACEEVELMILEQIRRGG